MYPVETTEVTATGTVRSGNGKLMGGMLTAGIDAASATIYDNTAASGAILRTVKAAAASSVDLAVPPGGIRFGKGVHVVLSGTAPALYLDI